MPTAVAACIEHTLLRAEATPDEIDALCAAAVSHGFRGVCVNPIYVSRAAARLAGQGPLVVTVCGFPLGASLPAALAAEAQLAAAAGADEIDMVIPIGLAVAGDLTAVTAAVAAVRAVLPRQRLKVILETGHFAADALGSVAEAALAGGPDFLKTSTGFGPRGATVADVQALHACLRGRAEIKAAGGIRTAADARALLTAGATRLGTSNGVAIEREWVENLAP